MNLLTLSPEAIEQVKKVIEGLPEPKPVGLRVGVRGGGCSGYEYCMVFQTEADLKPDFLKEEHDGLVVYIDPMSSMFLDGAKIDWVTDGIGNSGFKFENPNASRQCGCGKSFS